MMNILFRRVLSPIAIAALLILAIACCGPHRNDPLSASVSGRSVPVEHVPLEVNTGGPKPVPSLVYPSLSAREAAEAFNIGEIEFVVRSHEYMSRD